MEQLRTLPASSTTSGKIVIIGKQMYKLREKIKQAERQMIEALDLEEINWEFGDLNFNLEV